MDAGSGSGTEAFSSERSHPLVGLSLRRELVYWEEEAIPFPRDLAVGHLVAGKVEVVDEQAGLFLSVFPKTKRAGPQQQPPAEKEEEMDVKGEEEEESPTPGFNCDNASSAAEGDDDDVALESEEKDQEQQQQRASAASSDENIRSFPAFAHVRIVSLPVSAAVPVFCPLFFLAPSLLSLLFRCCFASFLLRICLIFCSMLSLSHHSASLPADLNLLSFLALFFRFPAFPIHVMWMAHGYLITILLTRL